MDTIGIDPGLSVTGWAIFSDNIIVDYGSIRAKSGLELQDKILFITTKLREIIQKYNIKKAAIEDSYVNMRNPYSSLKLSSLRGGMIVLFQTFNIEIILYSPTRIKKLLCDNGHASKEEVSSKVFEITKVRIRSKDINDAVATCLCLTK